MAFYKKLLLSSVLVFSNLGAEMPKNEAPFGTSQKRFGTITIEEGTVYWEETRPSEGGRTLIVSDKGDITPEGYSVRTRVHEYGGKSFTVHGKTIYFVNFKDQRIYVQKGSKVTPLTVEGVRFADLLYTDLGLVAVAEKHGEHVENFLALVSLETGDHEVLASGFDFYSSPTLSNEGKLAYLTWNLPNMPWDGTQLWVADFTKEGLKDIDCVAGSDTESIFEPQWGPDNKLYFVSDKNGWWNLYRIEKDAIALAPMDAEFGLPLWTFGMSTYAFIGSDILCTYFQNGTWSVALLNPATKELKKLPLKGTYYTQIRAQNTVAAFIRGSETDPTAIAKLDLKTLKETLRASNQRPDVDDSYLSIAQPVTFPSKDGRASYGFYYPPTNKDAKGAKGELPPLIVKTHGGPTAYVTGVFDVSKQYWTSRGFAVLDVNYGGSSGYGRAYRDSLKGNWGIVDIEDCAYGAKFLIDQGLVDPEKIAITGGSAGGYTTLAALTFTDLFTVGASYYGVSDLALLAKETHKFESRYLDSLVGPYPERLDLYEERSPLQHVERLNRPVVFFQGLEDKIVPPNQAEIMYEALKERNIPTKLITYEGEQHGFRKAQSIVHSLKEELAFYLKVFFGEIHEQ
jgi:dipeptidyl aminopeptidase/acylaminoacyl peptidase